MSDPVPLVWRPRIDRKLPLERICLDVRTGRFDPLRNDIAIETLGRAALGIAPETDPRWPAG